jgi:hypothetical protein
MVRPSRRGHSFAVSGRRHSASNPCTIRSQNLRPPSEPTQSVLIRTAMATE